MSTLDSILSGSSETAPAQDQTTETEQVTQTATEGEGQTEQTTEGQTTESDGDGNRVPVAALQAERQKVKRYTEQVASFEQTLKERDAAWERRLAQLTEAIKPKQEQAPPPDFFENPSEATRHLMAQQLSPAFDHVHQSLMGQAQMLAGMKYGDDKVQEAEQAFITALKGGEVHPSEAERIASSPNRYAAAVQWHQQRQTQAEIGNDPVAYKAKLEAEIREKVLAEINGGNGQQAQQRPTGPTPSNLAGARNVGARTGPAWSGPSPLDDIFNRARPSG
jgi:hypothetical protein